MNHRRAGELSRTIPAAGQNERRNPWRPDRSTWAFVEFLYSATDTLVEESFFFLEARRPSVVGRSGRGEDSDLRLRDLSVSRRHCELFYERGNWWIRDLGSTNGTRIDGLEVGSAPVKLVDDCTIELGKARLRFRDPEGAGRELIRTWCECRESGLPNERVLAQAWSRAVRRDAPAHLALFAVRDTEYMRSVADGPIELLLETLREVAEATSPEATLVARVERIPSIAVLFRSTEPSQARELVDLWHSYLQQKRPELAANCALVTVRGVDDRPLRRARAKLVACELAGNGLLNASDVDLEWCREEVGRIRRCVQPSSLESTAYRWLAVGTFQNVASVGHEKHERVRRDLARAVMALPPGSRAAIGWKGRAGLWFIAVDSEREPFLRALSSVNGVQFVQTERPGGEWLDNVLAQLEARKPVDVTRVATPFAQLLAPGGHATPAERLMEAGRRFEAALRLLAAVSVAKLANDFSEFGEGTPHVYGAALDTLSEARNRSEGMGSYLWLLRELTRDCPTDSTVEPIRKLLDSPWRKRASAAVAGRNRAFHSGSQSLPDLATRLENVLRELSHVMVSPDFQLADVLSVVPRRSGGGRVELVRLVGVVAHPPEALERYEFTDPGVWALLPNRPWVRLFPWVQRRACPECGVYDLFVASALLARHNRPLRYQGTIHGHEYTEEVPDDGSATELRSLLLAVDRSEPPPRTYPGFDPE